MHVEKNLLLSADLCGQQKCKLFHVVHIYVYVRTLYTVLCTVYFSFYTLQEYMCTYTFLIFFFLNNCTSTNVLRLYRVLLVTQYDQQIPLHI